MTAITATATHDLVRAAADLGPTVRSFADETERGRRVPPALIEQLTDARFFDMVLSPRYGGLEVDILTMMRVIEEVSIADGATGWVVGIGAGTSIVSAYLDEDIAREVYAPRTITGGPVAPLGRATPVDGGFRVSGRWPFASGCQHCGWLVAGAIVFDGPAPRMLESGGPDWRLCVFPAADAEILDTWKVSGLRGTGSHDIVLNDVFVPERRTIKLAVQPPSIDSTLARFPVFAFLGATVAPVATGIARRALDEFAALAETKVQLGASARLRERAVIQHEYAQAEATLRAARAFMYDTYAETWERVEARDTIHLADRAMLRLACTYATESAAKVVDAVYTLAGSTSIYDTSVLQRCLRDAHTATQHIQLGISNYEITGRVLLGLPHVGAPL
jgi:alkylation response protein AidB-like acyl-CoA dehydrogenase